MITVITDEKTNILQVNVPLVSIIRKYPGFSGGFQTTARQIANLLRLELVLVTGPLACAKLLFLYKTKKKKPPKF